MRAETKAALIERIRSNVPQTLRDLPAWLYHDAHKVPIYADGANRTGTLDSAEDRRRLVTFEDAATTFVTATRAVGLGIALGEVPGEDIQLSGIDVDACYQGTELDERALQILGAADSYAERSPSGSGLHVLGTGDIGTLKLEARTDRPGLELYSGARYFTVTGHRLNGAHVADISEAATLARQLFGADEVRERGSRQQSASDDPIIAALHRTGLYLRDGGGGKHLIRCPWESRHTPNDSGCRQTSSSEAAYFGPGADVRGTKLDAGMFRCQHAHCADRRLRHLREYLGLSALEDPLEHIRAVIGGDLEAGPAAVDAAMPPRFVCNPILPVAGANLAGSGSAGKTTTVLGEMVRVTCGGELYGNPVEMQGPCVLVTAEDGAAYARYILQQVLRDGVESGQLPERAAARAKSEIRIIGWHRATFGAIVNVDELGGMRRAPVYDLLLEMLAPLRPVYITLDPAVLFGAGERYGNDGDAYLAAMLHETALTIGACIQLIDHVAQSVARGGIIDQYAARGGTAKTDNARLARQLVRITPDAADGLILPPTVTAEEIAAGRILQLHTTKSNYAPIPPAAWLRRRRYWMEYLRAPSADEAVARELREREQITMGDAAAVVEYVRQQLTVGDGIRQTLRDLEEARPMLSDGQRMPRQRVRNAARLAVATGMLRYQELPPTERRGQRRTYLAPAPETTP